MAVLGTYDAIIVGAGACGSTTAYYLCQEGFSVALIDRGHVGREASWASAGMIGPESCPERDPWFLAATSLSRSLYDQLEPELVESTGSHVPYGGNGHLVIARRENEVEKLQQLAHQQQSNDLVVELLDGRETRNREPAAPEDVIAAGLMPEGRYIDARAFTTTIARAAEQHGAVIHEERPVIGFVREGTRVRGVRCGNDEFLADIVINTAGAWAGQIDQDLSHPVFPLHGQIMAVSGPSCGLRHNMSRAGIWGYVTPRPGGRIIVGATQDQWGYQKKNTPEGMAYLHQIIQDVMPALSDQPVLETWSGLRPGTIDNLPTVGPDPRVTHGYLWGAGHASSGMMQIPATAKVLVDLVSDRPPRLDIRQLSIERYIVDGDPNPKTSIPRPEKRFMSI